MMKNGIRKFDRPTSRAGFSLIELLIAIGIIAILIVIGIGVGMKVLGQSKEKATKANMALIMNAIETFHDEFNAYPGETTLDSDRTRTFKEEFLTDVSTSSQLWGYTERTNYTPPKSRDKIKALPGEVVVNKKTIPETGGSSDTSTASITFDFADRFGTPMRYSANGGLGGTPVIISAGLDAEFGSVKNADGRLVKANGTEWDTGDPDEVERQKEAAKDDIRSDK